LGLGFIVLRCILLEHTKIYYIYIVLIYLVTYIKFRVIHSILNITRVCDLVLGFRVYRLVIICGLEFRYS
jgi:hypothetical protein